MKVVILGRADWAGSGIMVAKAINSVGEIEVRHISLHPHVYQYPTDILLPICFVKGPPKLAKCPQFQEAIYACEDADLIHLWNDEVHEVQKVFPFFDASKVRSLSMTGSYYRRKPGYAEVNKRIVEQRLRLVVQNPNFVPLAKTHIRRFDSMGNKLIWFIPHAVDTDRICPQATLMHRNTIGCYRPLHGSTTAKADIAYLEELLQYKFPNRVKLVAGDTCKWEDRLCQLATSQFYFEYLMNPVGYIGRSALEACAFGIPSFTCFTSEALIYGKERIGEPDEIPLFITNTKHDLAEALDKAFHLTQFEYNCLSDQVRYWIEKHYSFEVVGEIYTQFFKELL